MREGCLDIDQLAPGHAGHKRPDAMSASGIALEAEPPPHNQYRVTVRVLTLQRE